MKNLFLITVISVFIISNVFSQTDAEFKKKYYQAEKMIEYGNFEEALVLYKELLVNNEKNANLNFKVGYCYLKTVLEKKLSIPYFEKAITGISDNYDPDDYMSISAPYETYYFLGEAYHLDYKFEESIEILENLKAQLPDINPEFLSQIDRKIKQCQNGIQLMKYPVKMNVTNLGGGINSEYKEHSPVFSADESVLIFTSKKEGTGGKMEDGQYFEDIYISNSKGDGLWTEPKSIGSNINTDGHEATIGLSVDGQQLLIYKDDNGDGNLYYSDLEGDIWTSPKKFEDPINTKANETHASISATGNEIYFTSNRKGGFGGLDIYVVRKLPNGEWGLAQNLGSDINTEYDERCPYIHPDGITLFFSSQGHFNMGGFDIFFCIKDEGKWQEATNMGYPVNTTEDDVFYTPTPDGRRAYYASHQTGGIGSTDIYMITLPGSKEKALTVMSGLVTLSNGQQPEDVYIEVTDVETGEIVGSYTPNSKTGKYLFILTPGRTYHVLCETEGFEPYEEDITVDENSAYKKIQRPIMLKPIVFVVDDNSNDENDSTDDSSNNDTTDNNDKSGDTDNNTSDDTDNNQNDDNNDNIVDDTNSDSNNDATEMTIENVFFGFDEHTTNLFYNTLDKLANYLIHDPVSVVEIGGHTDAQGDDYYNILLSNKRAKFVKDYLLKKGVKESCMNIKGYGETQLIAIDYAPFTRKYNRRVEFKVIKQGNAKLNIETIKVPNEYKLKK